MKTAAEILDKHLDALGICCDRESGYIDDYGVYPIIENAMEEYANQSKWISVEDRLPEIQNRDFSIMVISINDLGTCNVDRYDYILKGWINSTGVTHWQPLPKGV